MNAHLYCENYSSVFLVEGRGFCKNIRVFVLFENCSCNMLLQEFISYWKRIYTLCDLMWCFDCSVLIARNNSTCTRFEIVSADCCCWIVEPFRVSPTAKWNCRSFGTPQKVYDPPSEPVITTSANAPLGVSINGDDGQLLVVDETTNEPFASCSKNFKLVRYFIPCSPICTTSLKNHRKLTEKL